jgi:hypothetical protein
MEAVLLILVLGLLAAGIASGCDKWESEDQAQYEVFNPRVKLVGEKLVRQLPLRSDHVLGDVAHRFMEKTVFYCFESQSQDDALRIMRERHVDYLIVLDSELRVAGTLWMEDLVPSYARRYHSAACAASGGSHL